MLNDNELVLSNAQAITATAASTNIYDTGNAKGFAAGNKLGVRVHLDEAFNNLTSLAVTLQCDDNAAFASPKTLESRTFVLADLAAFKVLDMGSIPETDERYFRVMYTVTGTAPTTGKVTAYLYGFNNPQTMPQNTI